LGALLAIAELYIPEFLQKRNLGLLFEATADAFQSEFPSTKGLSLEQSLKLYAQFTRGQADKFIESADRPAVQSRLFANARRLGQKLKAEFHIENREELMRLSAVLYRMLHIEFRGEAQGKIVIQSCFFSNYYSSEVCRFISALDEGLLNGLSGGSKLSFSQRISDGRLCCLAYLEPARRLG
jgi:hypothetical protein